MKRNDGLITAVVTLGAIGALAVAAWTIFLRTPVVSEQIGFRGVAMETPVFKDDKAALAAANVAPEPVYEREPDDGSAPRAKDEYENVQVLGDLSVDNFNRFMAQITEWVSPDGGQYDKGQVGGCAYCHADENGELQNFAWDGNYAKIVSRRMIQMTQHLNSKWAVHVRGAEGKGAGVNCYTCHRGMPVPANIWFQRPGVADEYKMLGDSYSGDPSIGQNAPSAASGFSSMPSDPYTPYFVLDKPIRVNADTDITSEYGGTIQETEGTYALMIHMSTALGVNCTFCHNSRAFSRWELSPPARAPAWHAIRMLRDVNNEYLIPLKPVYPAKRLGPAGDAPKANCATCHAGAQKPLMGADMVSAFPSLLAPGAR